MISPIGSTTPKRLSFDAILFIMLWSAQFWSAELSGQFLPSRQINTALVLSLTRVLGFDPFASVLVLTLMAYVVADLWMIGSRQYTIKLSSVWICVVGFVVVPAMAAIAYRHNDTPALYIHDGAIQIEEAIKFILGGKNPYVEDFAGTPLAQWPFYDPTVSANPALDHLIYLPWMMLSSIPFYLVSQSIFGWYDQRFVYLLMLIVLLPLALSAAREARDRLCAFMILGLNPLFVPYFIEGRNDIVILFWLFGAIVLLQKNHLSWASILFAFAAASKQTAWFLAPFLLWYVMQPGKSSPHGRDWFARARVLIPAAVIFAAIMLPFVIWNVGAFMEDTITYQTGGAVSNTSYPIKSLGLGGLLLGFGIVPKSTEAFPFSLLQIAFGGTMLVILLFWQRRNNTLTQMLTNYAILLFVFSFFSRVFNDNHLGHALSWFLLPPFLRDAAPAKDPSA